MSDDYPKIKFSPFEALLIGEKNRIAKRQPMKNTIFVTRLNKQKETINLRYLFDLDEDLQESHNKDVIFKMPQRVRDFLKNRRLKDDNNGKTNNGKNVFCYEFEGRKIVVKEDEFIELQVKKQTVNTRKSQYKPDFKFRETLEEKIVNKIHHHRTRRRTLRSLPAVVAKDVKKVKFNPNRHLLRGKDGKFIPKSLYHKSISKNISEKGKYLSKYLHDLYLKRNREMFNNNTDNKNISDRLDDDDEQEREDCDTAFAIGEIIGLPKSRGQQFDITVPESILDEISKKYYEEEEKPVEGDFEFPPYPDNLEESDLDGDVLLMDIVYESHPKSFYFESKNNSVDYEDSLWLTEFECKSKRMYGKKCRNGYFDVDDEVRMIFDSRIISLEDDECRPLEAIKRIDDSPTTDKHLLSAQSIFLRDAMGTEILLTDLVKPVLYDCPFGALPDV